MLLDTNERSGADEWFGGVLNACREGKLEEDDYNFLHGYPTKSRVKFWYHRRSDQSFEHDDSLCMYQPYDIRTMWGREPADGRPECVDCWTERKRRARVLQLDAHESEESARLAHPRLAGERRERRWGAPHGHVGYLCACLSARGFLAWLEGDARAGLAERVPVGAWRRGALFPSLRFADAVLITPYSVAVYHFGKQRALNFARQTEAPSFWIQATDAPPSWFAVPPKPPPPDPKSSLRLPFPVGVAFRHIPKTRRAS